MKSLDTKIRIEIRKASLIRNTFLCKDLYNIVVLKKYIQNLLVL